MRLTHRSVRNSLALVDTYENLLSPLSEADRLNFKQSCLNNMDCENMFSALWTYLNSRNEGAVMVGRVLQQSAERVAESMSPDRMFHMPSASSKKYSFESLQQGEATVWNNCGIFGLLAHLDKGAPLDTYVVPAARKEREGYPVAQLKTIFAAGKRCCSPSWMSTRDFARHGTM